MFLPRSFLCLVTLGLFCSPACAEPHAVTSVPPNNTPGTFRFAILPDRTGGNRPEVYESALAKLNLLQPEFVLSTGDLIDGYTTDPKVMAAQWDEFDALANRLQMPFHYVPGNHDISNPLMLEAWKARHGTPWSSFVYQNVLFLILHTEDRPFGGLGAEQLAWVKQTLAANSNVRWTMLFFHRPLWRETDQRGFEQVREMLRGRKFTVFASHYHNYLKSFVDGMDAYVLATAGGSSALRGVEVGEFDHVTWVTMKPDGPVVANLALDGILPDDLITEDTVPRVRALRDGSWLQAPPVFASQETFEHVTIPLEFRNPTDFPLHVGGALGAAHGFVLSPTQVERTIAPRQTLTLPVELVALGGETTVHAANEAALSLTLEGSYELGGKTVVLPATKSLRFDAPHPVPFAPQLSAAGPVEFTSAVTMVRQPMVIQEDWDWSGPEDGAFAFTVEYSGRQVLVQVRTTDDRVLTAADPQALQDKLLVRLRTSAGTDARTGLAGTKTADTDVRATATGLEGRFLFTLPEGEKSFHLNVGWQDADRPENTKPSVLWWRDPAVAEFGEFSLRP